MVLLATRANHDAKRSFKEMKEPGYRFSRNTFLAGFAVLLLTPASCAMLPKAQGWDNMDEAFSILIGHFLVSGALALASALSGFSIVRKHKLALLWVIPSTLWVITIGMLTIQIHFQL